MKQTRVLLYIAVVLFLFTVIPGVQAEMFRFDATHSGNYSSVAGSTDPNNQSKWNYTTGGAVHSSPTVVGGVVYVGSYDSSVYAIDAITGDVIWSQPIGEVYSSPAVVGNVVYVANNGGRIFALDANNGGLELWNHTFGSVDIASSPAGVGGVVYIGCGDNHMYALNATNGAEFWNFTTGGHVPSSPSVANGFVYVGSKDNKTYAIYANNGTEFWNFTTGGEVWSSPSVANGVVYVGSLDNRVHALDANNNGEELWNHDLNGAVSSSPAVVGGVVYVGSNDGKVYALDANNVGAVLWTFQTGASVESSPAVANGIVYVGSNDNKTYAIYATNGTEKWSYLTGHNVTTSPSVANGVVYFGSLDNKIYALGNVVVVAPVASFTPSASSGTAPLAVTFTDTSSNTPNAWNWSFRNVTGNNTQIWFSTAQNPAHTFGVGNYSIVLNASNSAGFSLSTQTTFINVTAAVIAPVASFTPSASSGTAPLAVIFTDTSTNIPTAWNWTFRNVTGNNSQIVFNTTQNPVHTFGVGNYSIVLNASNGAGYNISTQVTFINVTTTAVNGTTTVGIYRSGAFFLKNSNAPGPADMTFGYGISTDTPLVGDWDGL